MTQTIAIIDYGSGNLRSAANAFERAVREAAADAEVLVTDDPDRVRKADRIVLPGVGAFADCRRGLDAVPGMVETLEDPHAAPGLRQVGRGDEPVVPAADHDGVNARHDGAPLS